MADVLFCILTIVAVAALQVFILILWRRRKQRTARYDYIDAHVNSAGSFYATAFELHRREELRRVQQLNLTVLRLQARSRRSHRSRRRGRVLPQRPQRR